MKTRSDTYKAASGPGGLILGLLGLLFIYLKLTGQTVVATWSWWWVLAPFWGPPVVAIGFIILFLIVVFILARLEQRSLGRRW